MAAWPEVQDPFYRFLRAGLDAYAAVAAGDHRAMGAHGLTTLVLGAAAVVGIANSTLIRYTNAWGSYRANKTITTRHHPANGQVVSTVFAPGPRPPDPAWAPAPHEPTAALHPCRCIPGRSSTFPENLSKAWLAPAHPPLVAWMQSGVCKANALPGDLRSMKATWQVNSPGTCAPAGGGITGEAHPADPSTFCCR
jgi:hypothetical protein